MKCLTCGYHPVSYIHCDRWDCPPLLVARPKVWMPEDEREHEPPDEDDDEIAVDWDENGAWPSENDEVEEEE